MNYNSKLDSDLAAADLESPYMPPPPRQYGMQKMTIEEWETATGLTWDRNVFWPGSGVAPVIPTPSGKRAPISPLPTSSADRKEIPLWTGALAYAPAAFALMAATSQKGNAKHNPGEPLHHARGKSTDHQDCVIRHMTDYDAMMAYRQRFGADSVDIEHLKEELGNLQWRVSMFVQEQCELLGIAPRAPRAILPTEDAATVLGGVQK